MSKDILYTRLLTSQKWINLSRRLKEESGNKCAICGKNFPKLYAHHIKPVETATTREEAIELCFLESNIQILCSKCHSQVHLEKNYNSREAHKQREKDRVSRIINLLTKGSLK